MAEDLGIASLTRAATMGLTGCGSQVTVGGFNMRRNAAVVSVLLVVVVAAALLIAGARGMFHGRLPADTLATTESQAEDVAFTVASNAGCGDFDSEYAFADPWQFDCTIGDVSYRIYVYGGDQPRSQGLAQLQADGRPYVAKAYYAVTAVPYGPSKDAVLSATPPPESVMDPFK